MLRRLGLVVVIAACGRLSFDPLDDGGPSGQCGPSGLMAITPGSSRDGVLCKGDVDTYSLLLFEGDELQADLTTGGPGWLTLEMVDDADNVRATRTLEPTLTGFADHTGRYSVRVAGTAATAGTPYHLTVGLHAGTYVFMGPAGNDLNPGTFASPVKTFPQARSMLGPGKTLVLLDGDYPVSTTGRFDVDCSTVAHGTAAAPIRIVALTERKAGIFGDGLDPGLQLSNGCTYWSLEGLHVESQDNNGAVGNGAALAIGSSSHMTVQRALLRHNNRYTNSHVLEVTSSSDILLEDTEVYDFHRAGVLIYGDQRATVRRVFTASRGYADISGGYPSDPADKGDDGVAIDFSVNAIEENSVSEGNGSESNSSDNATDCVGTHVLGTIANKNQYGFISSINTGGAQNTIGARYENDVAIGSPGQAFYFRSNMDAVCTACTSLESAGAAWVADQVASQPRVGTSTHCINCLAARNASYGIEVSQQDGGWSVENSNSFGNAINFSPMPAPELISPMSIDPQLGSCLVYLPASSPMRGAGKGGATIGAEVVYRYREGVVTQTPLWDPETGAFPCGAIVPGINDDPTTSCSGLHERLHVGTNNCPLPYPAL